MAEAAPVDALDERAVEEHLASVVLKAGKIHVSFNAITAVPQPNWSFVRETSPPASEKFA
ncbi:MAG: hypothetical protein HC869_17165 [Rhodospirillales bacterium]|nr:hypothetical protein [Rhodospirillales bacterium]